MGEISIDAASLRDIRFYLSEVKIGFWGGGSRFIRGDPLYIGHER